MPFKSSSLECLGYRDIAARVSDRKVPYPKLSVTKHDLAGITQFKSLNLFGKVRDPSSAYYDQCGNSKPKHMLVPNRKYDTHLKPTETD